MAMKYFGLVVFVALLSKVNGVWNDAHATFYGDMSGGETMMGACGYGNLFEQGYGLETTALSSALFNKGAACGACFEIKCVGSKWCVPTAGSIRVTATNLCPANYSKPSGNWCNPPQQHFDLAMPMFLKIGIYRAGIIPVKYRRVLCFKHGGVKFQIKGNPYWTLVLVFNVARAGDVSAVQVKGSAPAATWLPMSRNWGQNWQTGVVLTGQRLSFRVTTSDAQTLQFDDVAPPNWAFGQTFEGNRNF